MKFSAVHSSHTHIMKNIHDIFSLRLKVKAVNFPSNDRTIIPACWCQKLQICGEILATTHEKQLIHFAPFISFYLWGLSMLVYFRILWRHMGEESPRLRQTMRAYLLKGTIWWNIFNVVSFIYTTKGKTTTLFDFEKFLCVDQLVGWSLIWNMSLIP